jgi:hypothetical protein
LNSENNLKSTRPTLPPTVIPTRLPTSEIQRPSLLPSSRLPNFNAETINQPLSLKPTRMPSLKPTFLVKFPTSTTEKPTALFNGSITTAVSEIYEIIYCNTSVLCQGSLSSKDSANKQFVIQSPGTMRDVPMYRNVCF